MQTSIMQTIPLMVSNTILQWLHLDNLDQSTKSIVQTIIFTTIVSCLSTIPLWLGTTKSFLFGLMATCWKKGLEYLQKLWTSKHVDIDEVFIEYFIITDADKIHKNDYTMKNIMSFIDDRTRNEDYVEYLQSVGVKTLVPQNMQDRPNLLYVSTNRMPPPGKKYPILKLNGQEFMKEFNKTNKIATNHLVALNNDYEHGDTTVFFQLVCEKLPDPPAQKEKNKDGEVVVVSSTTHSKYKDTLIISLTSTDPTLNKLRTLQAILVVIDNKMTVTCKIERTVKGNSTVPYATNRSFDQIWFEEKEKFLHVYKKFMDGKAEYAKRGDPWCFSVLLYGPPGCGKTSLIKAMVHDSEERKRNCKLVMPSMSSCGIDANNPENFSYLFTTDLESSLVVLEDFENTDWGRVFYCRDFLQQKKKEEMDRIEQEKEKRRKKMMGRFGPFGGMDDMDDLENFEEIDSSKYKKKKSKRKGEVELETESGSCSNSNSKKEESRNTKETKETKETTAKETKEKIADPSDPTETGLVWNKPPPFSLSHALNILDGIVERTGQRSVWTTNLPDPVAVLDPAFLPLPRISFMQGTVDCPPTRLRRAFSSRFAIPVKLQMTY